MGDAGQWALAERVFSEAEAAVLGAPALAAAAAAAADAPLPPTAPPAAVSAAAAEKLQAWTSPSQLNGLDLGLLSGGGGAASGASSRRSSSSQIGAVLPPGAMQQAAAGGDAAAAVVAAALGGGSDLLHAQLDQQLKLEAADAQLAGKAAGGGVAAAGDKGDGKHEKAGRDRAQAPLVNEVRRREGGRFFRGGGGGRMWCGVA
jgi:hypothetical protein